MSNYFVGDLHFGGNYRFLDEIREAAFHDRLICENWNSKVTNGDDVWILGDIGRTSAELISTIAQLKGRKHLIKGNHDKLDDLRLRQLFVEVVDYKYLSFSKGGKTYKVVMSHYPIFAWENQHKGAILIYGHTHNTHEDRLFQNSISVLNSYFESERMSGRTDCPEAIAINVGAMKSYMNYCPRAIDELLEMKGRN